MRLVAVVLLALQCKLTIVLGDDDKEHVHFKIYVPEIIKHHIHTKTVFIHVYSPKRKVVPKKNEHVESHQEDWNSWSSYNDYNNYGDRHDAGHRSAIKVNSEQPPDNGHQHHNQHQNQGYPVLYRKHPKLSEPHYDDYRANYQSVDDLPGSHPVPVKSIFPNGFTGYSYPPQYAVTENVVEDVPDNSLENYKNLHEEGHSKRLHSETGHVLTNELSNFYDDKNEESHEALSTESKEVTESRNSDRYVGDEYLTTKTRIR